MAEILLKPSRVAEITGFTTATVTEMAKRGDIPGAIQIGCHLRFHPQTFYEFLAKGIATNPNKPEEICA